MRQRRVTKFGSLLITGIVASAVAAGGASAAMWVALTSSPERPTVGEPAEVLIRTFATFGSDSLGEIINDGPIPAPSGFALVLWGVDYPFELVAQGPRGESLAIEVRRDHADASLYRGEVAFPSPGAWTLQLPQFAGSADTPAITLVVDVAEAAPPWGDIALLAVAAALGAVATAATIGLMRRSRPSRDIRAR